MEITQRFLTNNNCYKAGRFQVVKGIMWHTTGANNPNLNRYIPGDEVIGYSKYDNDWDTAQPGGRSVCAHAFIGLDKDGKVRIYQTLPWEMVGWHSGKGSKGSANFLGYIGFEIQEGLLDDAKYFAEVYAAAVWLTVYLAKKFTFPINSTTMIDHSTGYKMGIASNHSDVMHWFPKHGKSMDTARADVLKALAPTPVKKPEVVEVKKPELKVDGYLGEKTIVAMQKYFKTPQDGVISRPSMMVRKLQELLEIRKDGYMGDKTIKALQKRMGTPQDGVISEPSMMVKELQRRLNKGKI